MKNFFTICMLLIPFISMADENLTLRDNLTYSQSINDVWGYVSPLGNEYALVGVFNGVSIVDVTDPDNISEVSFHAGQGSTWRDLKTWDEYGYVSNESGGGVMIIDLTDVDNGNTSVTSFTGDGGVNFNTAHNIFVDEFGVLYVISTNFPGADVLMYDLSADPLNPTHLGNYIGSGMHDAYARDNILYTSELGSGLRIVDVSDKSNPVLLGVTSTPSNFTHNAWISDDGNTAFTTDEVGGAFIASYDISDPTDINELDRIQSNPGSGVIPHNTHVLNDFLITSYYADGITIVDASRPDILVQTGDYDTSGASGGGFPGCWGAYPFLPSGNVLATDQDEGLFVLTPTYVRGAFLEGKITDANSGLPIQGVDVEILSASIFTDSDLIGDYATGLSTAGSYSVRFTKFGYEPQIIANVGLTNGSTTIVDVEMVVPANAFTLTGEVKDLISGNVIEGAKVLIENPDISLELVTDGNGVYSLASIIPGEYDIYAGSWGHVAEARISLAVDASNANQTFELEAGYQDDFLFDLGWTVTGNASTGIWEIGVPIGTDLNGVPSNPGFDVPGDLGAKSYVTGNGGGGAGTDDIDGGSTILTSPIFDATIFANPHIQFSRWFFNAGGSGTPNDFFRVQLTDGTNTAVIDELTSSANSWNEVDIQINDFMTPTSSMQIIVTAVDQGQGHISEAALDAFSVYDDGTVGIEESEAVQLFTAVSNGIGTTFNVKLSDSSNEMDIVIFDLTGRHIATERIENNQSILWEQAVSNGIYLASLQSIDGAVLKTIKFLAK